MYVVVGRSAACAVKKNPDCITITLCGATRMCRRPVSCLRRGSHLTFDPIVRDPGDQFFGFYVRQKKVRVSHPHEKAIVPLLLNFSYINVLPFFRISSSIRSNLARPKIRIKKISYINILCLSTFRCMALWVGVGRDTLIPLHAIQCVIRSMENENYRIDPPKFVFHGLCLTVWMENGQKLVGKAS